MEKSFYQKFKEKYTQSLSGIVFTKKDLYLFKKENDRQMVNSLSANSGKNIEIKISIYLKNIAALIKEDKFNEQMFDYSIPTESQYDVILEEYINN